MRTIRRSLGGFVVAGVIAASLVLMPATVAAKGNKGGDASGFCSTLASAIEYARTIDGAIGKLLLAQLEATYAAYCTK